MLIRCDECGYVSEMNGPKVRELGDGIQETYIQCAECGYEFTSFFSNDRVRELQEQQRTIQFEIKRLYRTKQSNRIKDRKIERLMEDFEDNKAKIRWEMQMIQNKMA